MTDQADRWNAAFKRDVNSSFYKCRSRDPPQLRNDPAVARPQQSFSALLGRSFDYDENLGHPWTGDFLSSDVVKQRRPGEGDDKIRSN